MNNVYSNQSNWPPGCYSAMQSPINLSQSSSKPCNLTCDLVMDDGYITQAVGLVSNEGLILMNGSGLGSCKFRGESYVCTAISINHPSHHTIEGVQADGEVIAFFKKPTGELLCVSALFRVNPAQTPSYTFFKQFVPYVQPTSETTVTLQNWSVAMMVPPSGEYYVYSGSTVAPPCIPCEWVVFKSMINMDTGDFAYLVRNVQAGSRSVQGMGDREVFYNDVQNLPGAMPHDNRVYLRMKSLRDEKPKKNVDLKGAKSQSPEDAEREERHPTSTVGKSKKALTDQVSANGGYLKTIIYILMFAAVCFGLKKGYEWAGLSPFQGVWFRDAADWIRRTIYSWYVWFTGLIPLFTPKILTDINRAVDKVSPN